MSQHLWFNKFIIVDDSYVNFTNFSSKNINFVSDLVNENCNFKSWETLKNEYHLDNKLCFQWIQLLYAIRLIWKQKKKKNDSEKNVEANLCYTRPSPHKKHKSNCITQAHRERIIFSVTTIIRQYTNFPKIL